MDGAASIVIDLILGTTAGFLTHESKRLLVGEGADPKTLAAIRKLGGSGGGREQGVERVVTKAIPFARWKTAPGDAGTNYRGWTGDGVEQARDRSRSRIGPGNVAWMPTFRWD